MVWPRSQAFPPKKPGNEDSCLHHERRVAARTYYSCCLTLCTHTHTHTCTHAHTHTQDGRLHQGDHLLQINEESIIHMTYDDVIAKLMSVSQAGKPVRLVVARSVDVNEQEAVVVPEINEVYMYSMYV